jgi:hypothetical protein
LFGRERTKEIARKCYDIDLELPESKAESYIKRSGDGGQTSIGPSQTARTLPAGERDTDASEAEGRGKCCAGVSVVRLSDSRGAYSRTRTSRYDCEVSYTPRVSLDLCLSPSIKYLPFLLKA